MIPRDRLPWGGEISLASELGRKSLEFFAAPIDTFRGGTPKPAQERKGVRMDVSVILQYVVIVGVLLLAVPFPIALVAAAVAWALAGFIAVGSLWHSAEGEQADRDGRGRPSG